MYNFFFTSRRRHTRFDCDWSSDVCSSDLSSERVQGQHCDRHVVEDLRHSLPQWYRRQVLRVQRYDHGIARIDSEDRKSTRLNSSHSQISYAVLCLKIKKEAHSMMTIN